MPISGALLETEAVVRRTLFGLSATFYDHAVGGNLRLSRSIWIEPDGLVVLLNGTVVLPIARGGDAPVCECLSKIWIQPIIQLKNRK